MMKEKQNIVFGTGSGELDSRFTYRLEKSCANIMIPDAFVLDSVVQN